MTEQTRTVNEWLARAEKWMPETRAFIDGSFVGFAGATRFETIAPRDGSVLAELEDGGAAAVDVAVAAARAAFNDGRWRRMPPRQRAQIMRHVDQQRRAIFMREVLEGAQVRHVGIHREQALDDDHDAVLDVLGADRGELLAAMLDVEMTELPDVARRRVRAFLQANM